METYLFVTSSIIFAWFLYRWSIRRYVHLANIVPSNKINSFLGFGTWKNKYIAQELYEHFRKYGTTSVVWNGPMSWFLTYDPQSLKEILTSKDCVDKPQVIYQGLSRFIGLGIATNKEPEWSQHRKIINPAFSNKNLLSFLPLFNEETDKFIRKIDIQQKAQKEKLDMMLVFRELTLNQASQTIFKRKMALTSFNAETCNKVFDVVLPFIVELILDPLMRVGILRKIADMRCEATDVMNGLQKFVDQSIQVNAKQKTSDPSYLPDIKGAIDYLFHAFNQNKLKSAEIANEATHIFIGAFETTSTTMFNIIMLLAMYPEHQERAFEEVSAIIPENRDVTMEDIEQMPFLNMIINEDLRLFPVFPLVFREATNDVTLSNGITLPKGQIIAIDLVNLHRNKTLWGPDADSFNPDNFLPHNIKSRHPYEYMPYTKGIRYCIGMRYADILLKLMLAKFIKAYKFTTDFKYEDLVLENHVTLKFEKNPYIILERR